MHQHRRTALAWVTVAVTGTAFVGISGLASTAAHAAPTTFDRINVDTAIAGSAFSVSENVSGDVRPEIIATAFGQFTFGQFGPIPAPAGTVSVYSNAAKNKKGGAVDSWTKTPIVTLADGITIPNQPTMADVDGDDDLDLLLPGGWFFDTFSGLNRGSLTWWENRANGKVWDRHDIVTGSPFAYHSVQHADMDGDGIADLVTVGEQAGNPSNPNDDVVETQILKGNGDGTFQAPVKVATGGGSLVQVYDVNSDGRLDIVSPQYFGPVAGQPFVPPFARGPAVASYVWFEQTGDASGGLTQANFVPHAIGTAQGTAFSIKPVANFRGDGVTRWVATNHTNANIAFPPFSMYPKPAVFEFTPNADPTQPWSVVTLTQPDDIPVTGGAGQAAPGDLNAGDLDGDGDQDLAVSGDGSRTVYWLEQQSDGTFVTHVLPDAVGYGQAGGAIVKDLNRDGINEMVFGSFDQNALAIWQR
jgi:hypothetical protein